MKNCFLSFVFTSRISTFLIIKNTRSLFFGNRKTLLMQTDYIDSPNFVDAIIQITKGYKPFQKKLCWCTDDLHQQSLKHLWVKVEQNMTKTYAYLLVKWKTNVPLGEMNTRAASYLGTHGPSPLKPFFFSKRIDFLR